MSFIIKSDQVSSKSIGNIYGINADLDFGVMLDFSRNEYVQRINGKLEYMSFSDAILFSRASKAEYLEKDGSTKIAEVNEPRMHYMPDLDVKGLLIERECTNLLANPYAPVTQTITIPLSSVIHGVVLSVEGSGTATMIGDVISLNRASASENNPQGGILPAGVSDRVVTITVTGSLTYFQLEHVLSNGGGNCATSFLPNNVTKREKDVVSLSPVITDRITGDVTIIYGIAYNERINKGSGITSKVDALMVSLKGESSIVLAQSFYIASGSSQINHIRTSMSSTAGGAARARELPTSGSQKTTTALAFSSGALEPLQSINGMSNSLTGTASAQEFGEMLFGDNICGVLTHFVVYPRKLSIAEIEKVTTSWL